MSSDKRLLWLSWKDSEHPLAGGAEYANESVAKELAKRGWNIQFVVGSFDGASPTTSRDGFTIERIGGRYSVYLKVWRLYKRKYIDWADVVIDECNTVPFFAQRYAKQPVLMIYYQLARSVWFYQMLPGLSLIGYWAESIYLRLLNRSRVLTISASTKQDLVRYGYEPSNLTIFPMGTSIGQAQLSLDKFEDPTLLIHGAIRPMKRPLMSLKAFEQAKRQIPNLKLIISGDGDGLYARHFKSRVRTSPFSRSITMVGRTSEAEKNRLFRQVWLYVAAPIKEGWGLTVGEAAWQGTQSVGPNVDGLRDSLKAHNGIVTDANTKALARGIVKGIKQPGTPTFSKKYQSFDVAADTFEDQLQNCLQHSKDRLEKRYRSKTI